MPDEKLNQSTAIPSGENVKWQFKWQFDNSPLETEFSCCSYQGQRMIIYISGDEN